MKRSIYQEDITIVNMYVPKNRALKYMKQKLTKLKGEIENSTIVGHFNSPLSIKNRITR